MARIKKEWLEDGAVDQSKITLTAKLDDNDTSAPSSDQHLANKKYVDDQVASISIPSVFELQGNWDADTNTPALANTDTGVADHLYYVNVAGSHDFGAGSKTFAVGDWVYNVNGAWEKADNNDDVLSVNGQTGAVVLDSDDVAEGATNKYVSAAQKLLIDSAVQPGDAVSGLTNDAAYVDAAGARTAAVVDSSAGSETDQAMSVAAGKAYTDAQVAAVAQDFAFESVTLIAGDISNGYIDLSNTPISGSVHCSPVGGPVQEEGVDFTMSTNRLTFAGDLSTYLSAGDKLLVHYAY